MYVEALNLNKDNIDKYTRDEIKNIYKKIALECHPDKLTNITDEDERAVKIERFKKASIGYKKAIEDFDNYGRLKYGGGSDYNFDNLADDYEIYNSFDLNFWKNTYDGIFKDKEAIKNTFIDVASYFFNRGFPNKFQKDANDTKDYYNPSTKIVSHNINLPITYYDLCTFNKRKLRILLKNVKEPVYINVCCKNEYPSLTRQYIDDDSVEHEIIINMIIDNTDNNCDDINYTHSISKYDNDYIDLFITLDINILDYLIGGIKKIKYIDNTYIDINIKPFCLDDIIVNNKGLLGGDLNVRLLYKQISLKDWNKISKKKRNKLINLIKLIYIKV
jgi:DnaJ-class molecular chaperone